MDSVFQFLGYFNTGYQSYVPPLLKKISFIKGSSNTAAGDVVGNKKPSAAEDELLKPLTKEELIAKRQQLIGSVNHQLKMKKGPTP